MSLKKNRILGLQESGLLMHWERKYYPQPDRCLGDINKLSRNQRISLSNLSGAFLVLLIGHALAFLVLIMEKCIYFWQLNRSTKPPKPLTQFKVVLPRRIHRTRRPAQSSQAKSK